MSNLSLIETLVCQATGVTPLQLRSRRRARPYVEARKLFSQMAHDFGFSLSEIGRYMGKDHTTIMHHVRDKNA